MKTYACAVLGTTTALAAGALAFIVLDAAESQRAARPAITERARVVIAHGCLDSTGTG